MSFRGRRMFLTQLGAGVTSALVLPSSYGTESESRKPSESRAEKALRLRIELAWADSKMKVPPQETNGDSERYPSHLANFAKGLKHDELDLVDRYDYELYMKALSTGKWEDFEDLPLGGAAKLSNPMAAFSYSLEGMDPHRSWTPPPPSFASDEQAAEMVELYWLALTRDVPFAEYESNSLIAQACADLTKFGPYTEARFNNAVTPNRIFRAPFPGYLTGPYVSQFLLLNVPIDNVLSTQLYPGLGPGTDYMTDYAEFLSIQNGALAPPLPPLTAPRYTMSSRDGVSYVHKDFPFQSDENATLILAGFGSTAASDSNPYKKSKTEAGFVSYGVPMFIDWVSRATTCAMKAGWYHKWLVHRRIRPEEFGGRVHNKIVKKSDFPISHRLFRSDVLNKVYSAQGTYLLAQSYPEGCPLHPSYPAVHATIAGAATTVLKALFDEKFVIPNPVVPNASGESLEPYAGEPLTVGGELNKLAANIALSRDAAGVHYRSDSMNGLRLGEAIAISLMRDLLTTTPDNQVPLTLHNFSGELVTIHPVRW
jgi:hypothetical protein